MFLLEQGKVRRMRPSPFHKGSGAQSSVDMESISDSDADSEVSREKSLLSSPRTVY